jgi:hypothetical protein
VTAWSSIFLRALAWDRREVGVSRRSAMATTARNAGGSGRAAQTCLARLRSRPWRHSRACRGRQLTASPCGTEGQPSVVDTSGTELAVQWRGGQMDSSSGCQRCGRRHWRVGMRSGSSSRSWKTPSWYGDTQTGETARRDRKERRRTGGPQLPDRINPPCGADQIAPPTAADFRILTL